MKQTAVQNARNFTASLFVWGRAAFPIIATIGAIASAIRTFQTVEEIFLRANSPQWIAIVAAACLTLAVEGTLFVASLSRENQRIAWRASRKRRNVTTIRSIGRMINVRLGREQPLSYDQLPDNDNLLGTMILITFVAAIASNVYQGLKPLIEQTADASLQNIVSYLLNAKGSEQLAFLTDFVFAIFPPILALNAGHLTARFAAEIARGERQSNARQERSTEQALERLERPAERRTMPAPERVLDWLREHPEDVSLSHAGDGLRAADSPSETIASAYRCTQASQMSWLLTSWQMTHSFLSRLTGCLLLLANISGH
jgi:hypothetical protein